MIVMKQEGHKNPIPTVDVIIQMDSRILLVKRTNEPFREYLAIPGGFVNEGETVEDAAKREVKEETSLDIELTDILGVYSDHKRDPRGHNMSTVFIGKIPTSRNGKVKAPAAADDASELYWINLEDIPDEKFAFDHKNILEDYMKWKKLGGTFWSSKTMGTRIS
jgi:ADP-ribose pyrophosphatase YjhB (NUDIX family)